MAEPLSAELLPWVIRLAQRFHDTYEALAPKYGYETAEKSRVPWAEVEAPLRALMCETVLLVVGIDPTDPFAELAEALRHQCPDDRVHEAQLAELAEARAEVERLTNIVNVANEMDDPLIRAEADTDRLREALDAVLALHEPGRTKYNLSGAKGQPPHPETRDCKACQRTWPCPTAAIVKGATE